MYELLFFSLDLFCRIFSWNGNDFFFHARSSVSMLLNICGWTDQVSVNESGVYSDSMPVWWSEIVTLTDVRRARIADIFYIIIVRANYVFFIILFLICKWAFLIHRNKILTNTTVIVVIQITELHNALGTLFWQSSIVWRVIFCMINSQHY